MLLTPTQLFERADSRRTPSLLPTKNSRDFQDILIKFIGRLLDRGHMLKDLTLLLLQAASAINKHIAPQPDNDNSSTLYLHWTYHPNGLQWQDLHRTFDTTQKDALPYDRMQVAIARPKNLRDILIRAKTTLPDNMDIELLITQTQHKD